MKNRGLLAAGMLLALVGGARCGGGSGSSAGPTTPSAPSSPAQPLVSADLPSTPGPQTPGLYQDGLGTYPSGDNVYLTPNGQDLFVRPVCAGSAPRALNLTLPPTARDVVAARMSKCVDLSQGGQGEGIFLHLPSPLMLQSGAVVGAGGAPPNANTSVSIFLFFNVDSNGDGIIKVPPDDQYNIRWQKGMYLSQRSETATTTVYDLTSLATQSGPDLSCSAELILRNTPLGEISKGFHCLPLVLTVTRQK